MPTSDEELAALERRWTIASSVVVGLVSFSAILVLIVVSAFARPTGGVDLARGWPPFSHSYNSLETLVSYWWPIAIPVLVVAGFVAWRLFGPPGGLMAVGGLLLVVAILLAVRPIGSYPQTKSTPGPGNCNAILGSGPYGDGDETCFDVRRARRFDVGAVGGSGFVILALGVALRVGIDRSAKSSGEVRAAPS